MFDSIIIPGGKMKNTSLKIIVLVTIWLGLAAILFSPCYTFIDLQLYSINKWPTVQDSSIYNELITIANRHLAINTVGLVLFIVCAIASTMNIVGIFDLKKRALIISLVGLCLGAAIIWIRLDLQDWVYSRWEVRTHFAKTGFVMYSALILIATVLSSWKKI